jgi:hypothetical protein
MIEPRKPSPVTLFWQQAHHGIEAVRRTQQNQQMHPPKLGRAEKVAAALAAVARKEPVDKLVWNKW